MAAWLPKGEFCHAQMATAGFDSSDLTSVISPLVRAQAAVFNVDANQGSVQVILEELRPVGLKVLVEKTTRVISIT